MEALRPQGFFLQPKLLLGGRVVYSLSLRHPAEVQVLFPDTNYAFSPFVLVRKAYFPTRTDARGSLDSATYELTSFELDSVFSLSLPVFVLQSGDSIPVFPPPDTLRLQEVVPRQNLARQSFRVAISPSPLPLYFNYPYWVLGLLSLFLLGLAIWGLLGRQIRRGFLLLKFRARHRIFLKDFSRLALRIESKVNTQDLEKIISLWKKHMEQLEAQPFSTYTSKEIALALPDQELARSLKNIDRAIYGQEASQRVSSALETLRRISQERFEYQQSKMRETLQR
ncbi:MAG: hypothetical protein OHK0053_22810 [Microscillaceae bacterium]